MTGVRAPGTCKGLVVYCNWLHNRLGSCGELHLCRLVLGCLWPFGHGTCTGRMCGGPVPTHWHSPVHLLLLRRAAGVGVRQTCCTGCPAGPVPDQFKTAWSLFLLSVCSQTLHHSRCCLPHAPTRNVFSCGPCTLLCKSRHQQKHLVGCLEGTWRLAVVSMGCLCSFAPFDVVGVCVWLSAALDATSTDV